MTQKTDEKVASTCTVTVKFLMRWKCSNSGWGIGGRARKKNIASMSSLCRANAQMMRATFVTFLIASSYVCPSVSVGVNICARVRVRARVYAVGARSE